MKTCIVNYEAGNLGSVLRALHAIGTEAVIADTPGELAAARRIILPGVGNFRDAMERLVADGWVDEIVKLVRGGRPILGICVGMQVLAEAGTESCEPGRATPGLGLVRGTVQRLDVLGCALRVPQQGWNSLEIRNVTHPLLKSIPSGTDVYFSNSYALAAQDNVIAATVDYGAPLTAAVAAGHIMGIQFHPEKSSRAGLRILKNFMEHPC
ncbi:imidazole glycerol phosphate synthase subunit HisH [Polaromonas sp.]|uniref:imidazole glycerol phosphate synthase subunit HisH n=1 Tax=Polaromonas sp. TaxID=1869339 RepID=UPI0032639513